MTGEADALPPDDEPPPRLLYVDAQVIVVDKPAGLPVHPSPRWPQGTLVQWLWATFDDGRTRRIKLAHRLDRETSGAIVATRDDDSNQRLHRAFEEQRVGKRYVAIVVGAPEWDERVVDAPLGPDRGSAVRMRMGVRSDGAPCVTELRVIERLDGHAVVEATPRSGRQHQIRAHLAHVGHPILGDKIYGPDEGLFIAWHEGRQDPSLWARLGMRRQALHAQALTVPHPWRGEALEVLAPLPADLRARVEALRRTR